MPKFAIDTNVYVESVRSTKTSEGLKQFLASNLPRTYLLAVVVQELWAGARTQEQVDALEAGVFGPFDRRSRVIRPSIGAFKESGRILAELALRDGIEPSRTKVSLVNDTLIAASCREAGITLLTRDSDYERIARHSRGFRHLAPTWE
ncbi:MAG TPA: PIN domain-containing protein [Terriglobia bacterium]|nr:PIN domain-containing protein [Terriglobia bacterium]